jgi:hypothetical protein
MLFPPLLVFSSFISLHEYKKDGGGLLAAQSGLYMLLALRRKQVRLCTWDLRSDGTASYD